MWSRRRAECASDSLGKGHQRKPTILALPQCYRDLDEITLSGHLLHQQMDAAALPQQGGGSGPCRSNSKGFGWLSPAGVELALLEVGTRQTSNPVLPIQFYQSSSTHTNPQETPLLLTLIEQTPHTTRPTKPEQTNQHIA